MSIFSRPLVADSVARALGALSDRSPRPRHRLSGLAADTTTVCVPTRHGSVDCTVYRAPGETQARPPVYVNLHGGGFVIRFPEQDDPWCRYLATHAGVVVVNVDYGTAPGHRFPVPVEQAYDVVTWAAGTERGWDGTRLCVGGQSAGGNLAASIARLALEQDGPRIALQVLHYPVLDLATAPAAKPAPGGRRTTWLWMSEVFDRAYVPDPGLRTHRLASPALEGDAGRLAGIAPALVVTAEYDTLRAEALAYSRTLDAAGALVAYRDVPGVGHGYDIRDRSPAATDETYRFIADHVVRAVRPA